MRLDEWVNKVLVSVVMPRKTAIILTDCQDVQNVQDQQLSVQGIYHDIKGSYVSIYYPWLDQTNDYIETHIPASFYVLQKQYKLYPWIPLQGINNGSIPEAVLATRRIIDSQQDYLSDRNINQIRYFPTYTPNIVIFEEKTHYDKLSQLQRLSQRRAQIEIEIDISRQMRFFIMEPLIIETFEAIKTSAKLILDTYISNKQIYEYKIDLDTSLHLLDNNMVILTVYFKPMKYIEFIDLFFYVRSYQQGTGQVYSGESVQ